MEMPPQDRPDEDATPARDSADQAPDDGFEAALEASIRRHRAILRALADR